jgi:hypothetical protein
MLPTEELYAFIYAEKERREITLSMTSMSVRPSIEREISMLDRNLAILGYLVDKEREYHVLRTHNERPWN